MGGFFGIEELGLGKDVWINGIKVGGFIWIRYDWDLEVGIY